MSISNSKWSSFLLDRVSLFLSLVIFTCLGVAAYLGYLLPQSIATLFETYQDEKLFFEIIKFLLIIYMCEYLNRVIYTITTNKYVQHALLQTRLYCYREWLLSYEVQRSKKAGKEFPLGEVLARLMNDTESIRELISSGTFEIFVDILFIGSCLYSFIQIDQFSGMVLMGIELITVIALILGSKSMIRTFLKVRKEMGILSRAVADVTQGMRENYYNDNGQFAQKKVRGKFQNFLREQFRANIFDASYSSVAESLYPIFLAVVGIVFSYSPTRFRWRDRRNH